MKSRQYSVPLNPSYYEDYSDTRSSSITASNYPQRGRPFDAHPSKPKQMRSLSVFPQRMASSNSNSHLHVQSIAKKQRLYSPPPPPMKQERHKPQKQVIDISNTE